MAAAQDHRGSGHRAGSVVHTADAASALQETETSHTAVATGELANVLFHAAQAGATFGGHALAVTDSSVRVRSGRQTGASGARGGRAASRRYRSRAVDGPLRVRSGRQTGASGARGE